MPPKPLPAELLAEAERLLGIGDRSAGERAAVLKATGPRKGKRGRAALLPRRAGYRFNPKKAVMSGAEFKARRRYLGYALSALAVELGCGRDCLDQIEKGKRPAWAIYYWAFRGIEAELRLKGAPLPHAGRKRSRQEVLGIPAISRYSATKAEASAGPERIRSRTPAQRSGRRRSSEQ